MAAPLTAAQLRAAFVAEGVDAEYWHDWLETDRPGPFAPNGVMIHHTGSNTSDATGRAYVRAILRPGYAGLPGPLCAAGVAPRGTVIMLSLRDANHAGGGCPKVLDAVIGEASWLMEREATPTRRNANGVDGNARFYGFEVMYSGGRPMSAAQLDQTVRAAAALCRAHGWTARSVIGHREWSLDKSDPGMQSMVTFRKLVQARLDQPAAAKTVGVKRVTAANTVKAAATTVLRRPISFAGYLRSDTRGFSGNRKLIQQQLKGQGFYKGEPNGLADTAHFDAVHGYQKAIGDKVGGDFGPKQFTLIAGWRDKYRAVK